jgi:NAD(P)-dependent dehydrogenase (short-subunit alcohol dehydrogenase family)
LVEKRLTGKKALVTGSGSGIGRAIALRLAAEGVDVAINDLNEENAKKTAEEVEKLGQKSMVLVADVSDSEKVQQMAKDYYAQWDVLDILVNNAGVGGSSSRIISMKEETFDRILRINLRSVFLMCKYFAKKMKKRKTADDELRGKIINMSSMRGRAGRALFGAYSVSKAGVISLTQTLSLELGKSRITVNAVCPGLIHTPMYGDVSMENLSAMSIPGAMPFRPVGLPEDVAGTVFHIASSDCDWTTGQCFPVSGGQGFV